MMYVSGETAEASAETTGIIEEIVRQQVIEMVWQSASNIADPKRNSVSTIQLTRRSFDNAPNKHHVVVVGRYQQTI